MVVPEINAEAVRRHATLLANLRRLIRRLPDDARLAGSRLVARLNEQVPASTAARRKEVEDELAWIEHARLIVLGEATLTPPDQETATVEVRYAFEVYRRRIEPEIDLLRAHDQRTGQLRACSGVQAHLDEWTQAVGEWERKNEKVVRPPEEVRAEEAERLDADVPSATDRIAFRVAQRARDLARQPGHELRTQRDWWEIAVVILVMEDMDTDPRDLGIAEPMRLGAWKSDDKDPFSHREAIRVFGWIDPVHGQDGDELRNWERLIALGEAAVIHLMPEADPPAAPPSADAGQSLAERMEVVDVPGPRRDVPAVEVRRWVGQKVIDKATIRGPALVRLFRVVETLSVGRPGRDLVPWTEVQREFLATGAWKGKVLETSTLVSYGLDVRKALEAGGFDRHWIQSAAGGARWLAPRTDS